MTPLEGSHYASAPAWTDWEGGFVLVQNISAGVGILQEEQATNKGNISICF